MKDVHEMFPDVPRGTATVSYEDAKDLVADALIYGNAYVYPSGQDAPSHVRLNPALVEELTTRRGVNSADNRNSNLA